MKTSDRTDRIASQEEISQRARELWLARGSPAGKDVEIWLEAERQLVPVILPGQKESAKPSRKGRVTISGRNPRDPASIDAGQLQERLNEFGEPPSRSPTSLDPSE